MEWHRMYLRILDKVAFDYRKRRNRAHPILHPLIQVLPQPSVRWRCGVTLRPLYDHRVWVGCANFGGHEPELEHFMTRTLQPGDRVLDVGAYAGTISMIAAKIIHPGGVVYAYEKDGTRCADIERAKKHNEQYNIIVHCGELTSIPMVEAPVKFIKIDVDGLEYQLFRSALPLIKRDSPAIAIEFSTFWRQKDMKDVLETLYTMGYEVRASHRKQEGAWVIRSLDDVPLGWLEDKSKAFNVYAKKGNA